MAQPTRAKMANRPEEAHQADAARLKGYGFAVGREAARPMSRPTRIASGS